jgi:MFS family permease
MAGKPAGRLGVLRERNFRLFFSGYAASLFGSSMVPVALSFAVLNEGRGPDAIGYVLAAETIPLVALLLLGGVVADRFSRRLTMLGSDLVRFASEGTLAVLLFTGRPPLWAFMALAAVLGAGQAFFNPAMTGLLPDMVSCERLQQANALRGIANSAGSVLGPSVAGVIVALGGAGWAIAIDAATYAVSAACLWRLAISPRASSDTSSLLAQLALGWHEFRSRTWLWLVVAQFATFNALSFAPFLVLGAVVAHDQLGGAGAWGAILAALGAGSVIGGIVAIRLRPRRPLVVAELSVALFALPVALLAFPAATVLIAVAAGAGGIGVSVFGTVWETALQQHVPPAVLSRVSSYDWFGSLAFTPLGYIIAGPVAGLIGTRTVLLVAAAWAAVSCLAVLLSRDLRRLGAEPATPPEPSARPSTASGADA